MCTEPRPDRLPERTRMQQLWQNLRYSFRALRKNPGFTTVAILSLALGIGANVAIVTLVNALLLRDLPVPHPERLVELSLVREGRITSSYPMFRELDRGQRVFSGLLGWMDSVTPNVEVYGMFARGIVLAVTANFYSALGATPLLGRLLTSEDVNPHAGSTSQVAVDTLEDEAAEKELTGLARALRNGESGAYEKLSAFAATNPTNAWGARAALALVLLCHKRREQQNGQHTSCLSKNLAIWMRSVVIEDGLCRSARTRRAAREEVGRNFRGA